MATRVEETVVDDLDGSMGDVVTCYLALGESAVEIDLSLEHRTELEEFLAPYIDAGRSVRPEKPATRKQRQIKSARVDRDQTKAVREWAKSQGLEVSERGRISQSIQEAFEAAH